MERSELDARPASDAGAGPGFGAAIDPGIQTPDLDMGIPDL
ncbi:MAG: hypothetical protein AAF480_01675 [Actinomycetota bacterium]